MSGADAPISAHQDKLLEALETAAAQDTGYKGSDEVLRTRVELVKLQFDYAWRAFQLHAQQRVSVFNFFILLVGASANAYALLLSRNQWPAAAAIVAALAAVLSVFFLFLDRRNEELVHVAEDVLRELERDVIFKGFRGEVGHGARRRPLAFAVERERRAGPQQLGIHLREAEDVSYLAGELKKGHRPGELPLVWVRDFLRLPADGRSPYRHGFWFPVVYTVIGATFALAFANALYAGAPAAGSG